MLDRHTLHTQMPHCSNVLWSIVSTYSCPLIISAHCRILVRWFIWCIIKDTLIKGSQHQATWAHNIKILKGITPTYNILPSNGSCYYTYRPWYSWGWQWGDCVLFSIHKGRNRCPLMVYASMAYLINGALQANVIIGNVWDQLNNWPWFVIFFDVKVYLTKHLILDWSHFKNRTNFDFHRNYLFSTSKEMQE